MTDESRILKLLEEVMDSGHAPEVVCRGCPDLLPTVQARLERLRVFEAELAAVFPTHGPRPGDPGASAPGTAADLPVIPGYTVLSVLGRGGMGIVYKARHLQLNRTVAIKMLLAGGYASAPDRARFMREAQAIAVLRHPHIIQVFDVGDLDGRPYFVMEYIEGGSLAQKLAVVPKPAREAAVMVSTLAEAIQAAHASGIVHRDLKPANILLTADGTPKIGDFGLARSSADEPDLTLDGTRLGTPSYMSPEQAIGRQGTVGPAADIYSLGTVLYEMLTGRPPFKAESPAETERQVIAEEPAPPSRLNAKVPRDLETICLKCLCKDPQRRYATASALADDLHRFLRGEPIAARRAGAPERLGKWVRRHPARTAAWLGGVVALGSLLGSVLWTASQRAAIDRAVSEDLTAAVRLEQSSDWRGARNILERAKTQLASGSGNGALYRRADEIEQELNLVDRLGAMRFARAASKEVEFDRAKWWRTYRGAFLEAELLREGDTSLQFGSRVAQSPARTALVDAMDDWSICAPDRKSLQWLLDATRITDPGPSSGPAWRDRARDLAVWQDRAALIALARAAPVETEPVTLLLMLAGRLSAWDMDESVRMLRRIQAAHPSNFWANFALAESLDMNQDPDVIGFYRVAVALKPEASVAHFNLGEALTAQKRIGEAIDSLQRAASLDPNDWRPHHNLAISLGRAARFQESLEHARTATRLAPDQAVAHVILGAALKSVGRYPEAIDAYKHAIDLAPAGSAERARFERSLAKCEEEAARPPPSPPA
ncbi:MAG TPA: serine/threonine-protein kinase, partial [Phycisphaerales bacterium]|nr:serine/threonine-protein kinase [Phycisphaerales bacterium]